MVPSQIRGDAKAEIGTTNWDEAGEPYGDRIVLRRSRSGQADRAVQNYPNGQRNLPWYCLIPHSALSGGTRGLLLPQLSK